MFFKICVLKNFTNFTKTCVEVSFYIDKFAVLKRRVTLLKEDSNAGVFL